MPTICSSSRRAGRSPSTAAISKSGGLVFASFTNSRRHADDQLQRQRHDRDLRARRRGARGDPICQQQRQPAGVDRPHCLAQRRRAGQCRPGQRRRPSRDRHRHGPRRHHRYARERAAGRRPQRRDAGIDDTNLYVEDGAASGIGVDIAVTDPETGDNIESATVTITDPEAGDLLTVNLPLPPGITVDTVNSTATTLILIGSATADAYAGALGQVGYSSSSDDPTDGGTNPNRVITVTVNDGTATAPRRR